ncbi:MAG: DUF2142 domain-containing protein [Candidatus Saccharimonas sp.]
MKFNSKQFLKQPERLFLVVSLFFGIVSAFMLPVLTGPDEGAHFWVSYSMFTKNEQIPQDLLISANQSVKDVSSGRYINDLFEDSANLQGDDFALNYSKDVYINSTNDSRKTGIHDLAHIPQAIGILLGRLIHPSVGVMVVFGRLFNLAVYIGAIYIIIKRIKYGRLALAFVALFPMMIQQASTLSYDVMNTVAIFAWVAFVINLSLQRVRLSRKQVVVLGLLAILLIATKRSNVLLLGLLPFLPPSLYFNQVTTQKMQQWKSALLRHKRVVVSSLLAVAVLATIAFLYLLDHYLAGRGVSSVRFFEVLFNTFFRPEVNTQLDPIITSGVVGNFAWLWYRLPAWIVFLQLSVFGLILLGDKTPVISKKFAVASGIIFIGSVLGITVGMYFAWTLLPSVAGPLATFIQGMQGRYFTPLLILLIPAFAYLQKHISVKIAPELLHKIAWSTAIFSLTIYVILTWIFFYTPADGVKDILLK